MATSTRHKILDQWKAGDAALENYYYHLMYISKLAGVESDYLNKTLAGMIFAYEEMKKLHLEFRRGL